MAKKTISTYGKENFGVRANGALILTKGEVRKLIDISGETNKLLIEKAAAKGFAGVKPYIEELLYKHARA